MTTYRYIFLELRSDQIISEIDLYGVYANRQISGPGQFNGSFNFDQTGKKNIDLVAATVPGKTWLVVEREGVPVWWGITWSRTYQSQAKTCQLFAWGFEAYPQKRKITQDLVWNQVPVTQIFVELWGGMLAADGSNLGIDIPDITDGPLKDLVVLASDNNYYSDPMQQLCEAADGFDWTIDLQKNASGLYTKSLRVGWPSIGQTDDQPDRIVFEYPGNIVNYYGTEAMGEAGTNVFTIGAGEGSAMPATETTQASMIANGWPRWDVDVSYKDVTDAAQIAQLAAQQKVVRKPPMESFSITVKSDVPPVVGTYNLGDSCKLELTDPKHPSTAAGKPGLSITSKVIGYELTPSSADETETSNILLPGDISTLEDVVEPPPVTTPPTGPPTPPPGNPTLLYGVAIGAYAVVSGSPKSKQATYNDYVASCGTPDYVRIYLNDTQSSLANFPTTWPVAGELSDYATRGTYLSFKPDFTTWNAGGYDSKLTQLVNNYPGLSLDLSVYHEPEDNVEAGDFTLATWKLAMSHLVTIAASINDPRVKTWATMGGFTWDTASGRTPDDWYVAGINGYGVDTYNDPSARHDGRAWKYPAALMANFTGWANAKGLLKGWIEIGCAPDFNDVNARAVWIAQAGTYLVANGYSRASYFDLVGPKADWDVRAIVKRTAYFPSALGTVTSVVADPVSAAAWRAVTGK